MVRTFVATFSEDGKLRVANIVARSKIYGPGWRTVIWFQGCTLACKGCWNKDLWPKVGGESWEVDELLNHLLEIDTEGVTFLGGEPLEQAEPLATLMSGLKKQGRSIFLYSGFNVNELNEAMLRCYNLSDIAVMGRYVESLRNTNLRWRGSSNQIIEFNSETYTENDLDGEASEYEIHIDENGHYSIVGYPPQEVLKEIEKLRSET